MLVYQYPISKEEKPILKLYLNLYIYCTYCMLLRIAAVQTATAHFCDALTVQLTVWYNMGYLNFVLVTHAPYCAQ